MRLYAIKNQRGATGHFSSDCWNSCKQSSTSIGPAWVGTSPFFVVTWLGAQWVVLMQYNSPSSTLLSAALHCGYYLQKLSPSDGDLKSSIQSFLKIGNQIIHFLCHCESFNFIIHIYFCVKTDNQPPQFYCQSQTGGKSKFSTFSTVCLVIFSNFASCAM